MTAEVKLYHRAKHIRANGDVSALCFTRPKRIDLAVASWTSIDADVTCPKCKKLLAPATTARTSDGAIDPLCPTSECRGVCDPGVHGL